MNKKRPQPLKSFLVSIVEDPDSLIQLRATPGKFIQAASISDKCKKILLGGNSVAIKNIIKSAVGKQTKAMIFGTEAKAALAGTAAAPMIFGTEAIMIFGTEAKVQVTAKLKAHKFKKPGKPTIDITIA